MIRKLLLLALILSALILIACNAGADREEPAATGDSAASVSQTPQDTGGERGIDPGSGMMARHHVTVPAPYAGLVNRMTVDQVSLDRGAELYSTLCASCHGDGGMGDGPAGEALDPAPAPVAQSSQMLGDDLLFWRISAGGAMEPFNSAMPAWEESLEEQARWDLVNYMRALGQGQVVPRSSAGGATFDPAAEGAARAEMLSRAMEQGVIDQAEADLFDEVHSAMDELVTAGGPPRLGSMTQTRDALLADLVEAGTITQQQAEAFHEIHTRLEEAGLME